MVNQGVLDEIYELEEVLASLAFQIESNAEVVKQLRIDIDRLKGKLYYDERPLPMGGEVSS
jgi:hypothetical protein